MGDNPAQRRRGGAPSETGDKSETNRGRFEDEDEDDEEENRDNLGHPLEGCRGTGPFHCFKSGCLGFFLDFCTPSTEENQISRFAGLGLGFKNVDGLDFSSVRFRSPLLAPDAWSCVAGRDLAVRVGCGQG
jgi:hypothetical protein